MPRLVMDPAPGERLLRHVGDRVDVTLRLAEAPPGGSPGLGELTGWLRTTLGRGRALREETIALRGLRPGDRGRVGGAAWHDLPLRREGDRWVASVVVVEPGYFHAKPYLVDAAGRQHWPEGADLGISVHPDPIRSHGSVYCAMVRSFGPWRHELTPHALPAAVARLDEEGWSVLPPAGTLRDLTARVPFIVRGLGCRILHLLPVGPVPTTHARMGVLGSPYAQLDLTAIDPALVVHDGRATGVDQFRELTDAVHAEEGLVVLDVVLHHTGWEARLLELHPEWYEREPDGRFHSPGAWGVTWGDLVELDVRHQELWEVLAGALLAWCDRGVDGFRLDAGYMIPAPVWQYLIARVRQRFPDCLFLLEGLGGAWETTAALLTEGGMNWAYSELFQNHGPRDVAGYLDHALRQSARLGALVHYSETHDNDRLARRGARWSLLRNRLSALGSAQGAWGFSAGVEWLCTTKLDVHHAHGIAWGNPQNLVSELSLLNRLVAEHPCFLDGARVERLSAAEAWGLVLLRTSAGEEDRCLVVLNLDAERPTLARVPRAAWAALGNAPVDLLGGAVPTAAAAAGAPGAEGELELPLTPGQALCLAPGPRPRGLGGAEYRRARARAACLLEALAGVVPPEDIGPAPFEALAALLAEDPIALLGALRRVDRDALGQDAVAALRQARDAGGWPTLVRWRAGKAHRVIPVPAGHLLVVEDAGPFAVHLRVGDELTHRHGVPVPGGYLAALWAPAVPAPTPATLELRRFTPRVEVVSGALLLLPERPALGPGGPVRGAPAAPHLAVLLATNGRGAMSRLRFELGAIRSKYDALLAANLHPTVPVDRHVLVKRLRAWVNADGFLTALDRDALERLEPGVGRWQFLAYAGDGRHVPVQLTVRLAAGANTVEVEVSRPLVAAAEAVEDVRITLRFDLEDRSFHGETTATDEARRFFETHVQGLEPSPPAGPAAGAPAPDAPAPGPPALVPAALPGFRFVPVEGRSLRVTASAGRYHPAPEWSLGLHHTEEEERGLPAWGDAYSPGWFELPLAPGGAARITLGVEQDAAPGTAPVVAEPDPPDATPVERALCRALRDFLVRRGERTTIIAGYPWFLDWGRDSLLVTRCLIELGWRASALDVLHAFGALERAGTLPNALAGERTDDRDTSDAPLWWALALEEATERFGPGVLEERTPDGRTLLEVLTSIADGLVAGAPNGVRFDAASGLLWSPAHFTWMDTRYPACSPREGYPVEIQALWVRLLRHLARRAPEARRAELAALAHRAEGSLGRFVEARPGRVVDTFHAGPGGAFADAVPDDHLRPNALFLVSLGLLGGAAARALVAEAATHLLVPGALRSLAPLRVEHPLPIHRADGSLLGDPHLPYRGTYRGPEDERRKPAYHNGTAWPWLLGTFAEALAAAYPGDALAHAAACSLLGSGTPLLAEGCWGHLPELLDGDAPHTPRGCDAQAWSAAETLRALRRLGRAAGGGGAGSGDTRPG